MSEHSSTYPDNRSSEEIRGDIQETRRDMSSKLDQLQERLSPQALKDQATETVRDTLTDGADSIMEYVRGNRSEISTSLVDSIRRNPIPAALVGVGIGWLLIESLNSDSNNASGDRYRPYSDEFYEEYVNDYSNYDNDNYGDRDSGRVYRNAGRYSGSLDYSEGDGGQNQFAQAAGNVQDKAGNVAEQAKDAAGNLIDNVQDTAQNLANRAQNAVQDAAGSVQDTAQGLTNRAQSRTQVAGNRAQYRAQQMGRNMSDQANQVGNEAQYQAMRAQYRAQEAGQQAYSALTDNPLAFGGVALAVGAAVGLLLPATQREDQLIGEYRDELVDRGQNVAQEAAQRAQKVAEEVAPELQQTAEKVAGDVQSAVKDAGKNLKQTGQEAVEDVKQTAQKAQDRTEEEAKKVGEKAKSEANKSSATS